MSARQCLICPRKGRLQRRVYLTLLSCFDWIRVSVVPGHRRKGARGGSSPGGRGEEQERGGEREGQTAGVSAREGCC